MATRPVCTLSTTVVHPPTTGVDNSGGPDLIPLTAWDLPILSAHYIQKGLLFSHKPPDLLHRLASSLSLALSLFRPLAGRLHTRLSSDSTSATFFIDCQISRGAELVHASADGVTVADISAADVPKAIVYELFPLNSAVCHDGHSRPLLAVQVTELVDGYFLGCALNHAVADGTAFWHFFRSWSEIARAGSDGVSRPPMIRGFSPVVEEVEIGAVPFVNTDDFIERYFQLLDGIEDRFFHFTAAAIAELKRRAREELLESEAEVSSFQALSALAWRGIVRAWKLPACDTTSYRFSADCRRRLVPPLPAEYFGNAISTVADEVTVGELLGNGLGWAAARLRGRIAAYDGKAVRAKLEKYRKSPDIIRVSNIVNQRLVVMGSSPRFDVYGVDFGWGEADAVRSGIDNKFDGKITAFPAREGGGAAELEICLSGEAMASLMADIEFMQAVSH